MVVSNTPASAEEDVVVLVHGLWMHAVVFVVVARWLRRQGLDVRCFSYASVSRDLDANSEALARFVAAIPGRQRIHLVGHSLGGLVILGMLARGADPRIARAVLMGSPCNGSHCASTLLRTPLSPIIGRSIAQGVVRREWPFPPQIQIGILSGMGGIGMGRIIPGLAVPNDGVVTVKETFLSGCAERITLPVSHSAMLFSKACAEQVSAFLLAGHFVHE